MLGYYVDKDHGYRTLFFREEFVTDSRRWGFALSLEFCFVRPNVYFYLNYGTAADRYGGRHYKRIGFFGGKWRHDSGRFWKKFVLPDWALALRSADARYPQRGLDKTGNP